MMMDSGASQQACKMTGPRRSWLFTPATRPERFGRAAEAGADVLILDLEDSVTAADKAQARSNAIAALSQPAAVARALRINGLGTQSGLADVLALLQSSARPDYLILPKADSPAPLRLLDQLLREAEREERLVAQVESAAALLAIREIAHASPRLEALILGAADLAADLGAAAEWEPLLHARSRLVAACALAGLRAIDTPFFRPADAKGLHAETARAVALGFAGKAAIHPAQVGPINAALTPTAEAVAEARAVLEENRKGVGMVAGSMVDEAVARRARRVLAAAGEE